ncbi:MAG: HAMP domain-containing histidine kinase [Solirubrobacterales bacterium]|nr:HAMP domain-containing histidine kinase [Solirubrobacterales bacterium]
MSVSPLAIPRRFRRWLSSLPIRWKLAAVTSGLTFIILLAFGFAVGQLTTQQLRDNYAADTKAKAAELSQVLRERNIITASSAPNSLLAPLLRSVNGTADVILRANGSRYAIRGEPGLGPLTGEGVKTVGDLQVSTVALNDPVAGIYPIAWVRYGRSIDRLNASIARIWISILAGALGATLLAALGGVMLARRAMRPIADLTTAAGEIARTRDPEVTLKDPVSEDEVAELTRSFNEMLHELSLARTERESALNRQRAFIADASHELRTPLTSVLANLELLDHSLEGQGRELDLESVESALRSSKRMRRLVADLQILARADSDHDRELEAGDLTSIARHAVDELDPLTDDHTVLLNAPEPVPVCGDGDRLHRIVTNLVDNAVRHTPSGCTVEVRVEADRDSGSARLIVDDDGPGIPDELRPRIFDRFVRSDGPSDRTQGDGTGLGLAIVQAIAQRHGGSARVSDSPKGGAEFIVELPLRQTDQEESVREPLAPI